MCGSEREDGVKTGQRMAEVSTGLAEHGAGPVNDDTRWAVVTARDGRWDGVFVYAVRTTGVYCRPGCRSRLPHRKNVEFFSDPAAAAAAGYRPCRRCRPDKPSPEAERTALVTRACRRLEEAENPPTLRELAGEAGLSPYHFHRLFTATVGVTPKQYAIARRVERFQEGLAEGRSVTEAIYEAGFGSSGRAYAAAAPLGMTPSTYKNGGATLEIRYALSRCPLGWVLVAATPRGVSAIALGDDPGTLVTELRERFPRAKLREADPEVAAWLERVVAMFERPDRTPELPLDIRGTVFQRRVWKALQEIPPGETASYAQIAASIGRPKAVRAVARACSANPVAVAIPCHRVVGSDGDLRGYRWGVERKRALLDLEKVCARRLKDGGGDHPAVGQRPPTNMRKIRRHTRP